MLEYTSEPPTLCSMSCAGGVVDVGDVGDVLQEEPKDSLEPASEGIMLRPSSFVDMTTFDVPWEVSIVATTTGGDLPKPEGACTGLGEVEVGDVPPEPKDRLETSEGLLLMPPKPGMAAVGAVGAVGAVCGSFCAAGCSCSGRLSWPPWCGGGCNGVPRPERTTG
mmetsp:Transcript_37243/g.115923  ORF Transcript_37243/g.115923 Transcript_37243/m.115923 type:complete len:165 (-) Transcript_37243:291-785(-)